MWMTSGAVREREKPTKTQEKVKKSSLDLMHCKREKILETSYKSKWLDRSGSI